MTVITAERLGKKYIIGHQRQERYLALRDVIAHTARGVWQRLRHPLSPNLETTNLEEIWALRDINLEIKQGEQVGIIGRNGAGKTTLLKILSRITPPTSGRVHIKGRVASLLEVGTGFHQELTGRENIYLNGAILGMTRQEIKKKFDEIVAFAEVEKFLDTPVKRYSSGMYVRLAFAVAAHLEPEILLVDEVLAVGDIRFQRKCLGKMQAITSEGRTVLFVSHSMPTITSLCQKAILLECGKVSKIGSAPEVVLAYSAQEKSSQAVVDFSESTIQVGDDYAILRSGSVKNSCDEVTSEISISESVKISMSYTILKSNRMRFIPNFHFYTTENVCAFVTHETHVEELPCGDYLAECYIPENFLNEGVYFVGLALSSYETGVTVHFYERNCLSFNVKDPIEETVTRPAYSGAIPGVVRPHLQWRIRKIS